jgi:hypothetical protein
MNDCERGYGRSRPVPRGPPRDSERGDPPGGTGPALWADIARGEHRPSTRERGETRESLSIWMYLEVNSATIKGGAQPYSEAAGLTHAVPALVLEHQSLLLEAPE